MTRRQLLATILLAISARVKAEGERRIRVRRIKAGRVDDLSLEEYVAAVVPVEIGRGPKAALEAQAVAARSYAVARLDRHRDEGADLCDGTHCQAFAGLERATVETRAATEATRGLVLTQKGRVIAALYHAVCGGHTARPRDVWDDEEVPDLVPVADDACLDAPGARWSFRLPRRDMLELGAALSLPEARFFEVFGLGEDGRVTMVRLAARGGKALVVRGFDFRRAASELWGWASVRSTAFEVSESRREYLLLGRGTGHGAGLCQAGAIARAMRGETREEILALYYKGAAVLPLAGLPA